MLSPQIMQHLLMLSFLINTAKGFLIIFICVWQNYLFFIFGRIQNRQSFSLVFVGMATFQQTDLNYFVVKYLTSSTLPNPITGTRCGVPFRSHGTPDKRCVLSRQPTSHHYVHVNSHVCVLKRSSNDSRSEDAISSLRS